MGLVAALRQSARAYRHQLDIQIVAGEMPALPAAVEVAAFHIAREAVTNVVKHAQAQACIVTVSLNGNLRMTVEDDGIGCRPDVLLMDLHMPDMNGIAATAEIVPTSPHIAVLVLTMVDDDESLFAAMQAGARGYLLKDASKQVIVRAIRDVADRAAIFSPAIASRMMSYFSRLQQTQSPYAFPELTDREREILQLMAEHRSNKEIAQLLHLSPKTVRNYTSHIFGKLQVADRTEAIIQAQKAGLGK